MSSPSKDIENLLQKEMSRKEFLRIIGAGLLGVVGITGAIQSLSKLTGSTTVTEQAKITTEADKHGYGMSAYGK